jgi:pimeloyl-ACP methyl ester carboxylesterase
MSAFYVPRKSSAGDLAGDSAKVSHVSEPLSHFTGFAPRLHYLEWNPGAPRTIVLLHGNSANAWWWQPLAAAIGPAGLRLLALDQRGHGDSEWIRPPAYGPLEYAHDLARFIAEYAPARPFVAGHSMGGINALTFAAEYPGIARAIVAIDSAVTSSDRRNHYLRRLRGLPVVTYPDRETALARFRLMPNEGAIAPATLRTIAEKSLGETFEGRFSMKFDRESFLGSDGIDVLGAIARIREPLLLIRAERSRIMTADGAARALVANPKAKLVTIPGAHHHVILEQPAAVARAIGEFIASV